MLGDPRPPYRPSVPVAVVAVDTEWMVETYAAGASLRAMAAAAGCSYGTIYNRLRAAGVPRRRVR